MMSIRACTKSETLKPGGLRGLVIHVHTKPLGPPSPANSKPTHLDKPACFVLKAALSKVASGHLEVL